MLNGAQRKMLFDLISASANTIVMICAAVSRPRAARGRSRRQAQWRSERACDWCCRCCCRYPVGHCACPSDVGIADSLHCWTSSFGDVCTRRRQQPKFLNRTQSQNKKSTAVQTASFKRRRHLTFSHTEAASLSFNSCIVVPRQSDFWHCCAVCSSPF
jgi:hypothetical protein